ncbi:MAG TPA: hypothetical protein VH107_01465 [Lacipirellulaceae bacterium]|jgi:hypothetical protein|nr:hypothetical protein [Lacipirellulaceae bacterium]
MKGLSRTFLLALLTATAAAPVLGQPLATASVSPSASAAAGDHAQFERGEPHQVIDSIGWVFGIPKKIILWDRRAVNHQVSPETEERLAAYMQTNGLATTKVRINEYDPLGEWRRLAANKEVGAGWRYTFGAFGTLGYTLFPGRLFGEDGYNPYTDTVYVYSDISCLAEEQASYAKIIRAHRHPGTYVAVVSLPIVQLWPEKQSKTDVLDYTLSSGTPEQNSEATRVLYAEYGAEVGGQASMLFGAGIPLTLAGAGIGHVAAKSVDSESPAAAPSNSAELPSSEVTRLPDTTVVR